MLRHCGHLGDHHHIDALALSTLILAGLFADLASGGRLRDRDPPGKAASPTAAHAPCA
jgi:hypothetical protein